MTCLHCSKEFYLIPKQIVESKTDTLTRKVGDKLIILDTWDHTLDARNVRTGKIFSVKRLCELEAL